MVRLEREGESCAIASPVWHELLFGTRRLPRGKRREALEAYLSEVVRPSFPILPYDEEAAGWHALERARLEKQGRPAPHVDGQIAAIAFANGLQLVTRNVKDFSRFRGLNVADWAKG
jgi:tRNA(fMet)-specific endonuclease VapC